MGAIVSHCVESLGGITNENDGRPECSYTRKEPVSPEDHEQRLLCEDPCLSHNCACHAGSFLPAVGACVFKVNEKLSGAL
jgi:hypothetical protein